MMRVLLLLGVVAHFSEGASWGYHSDFGAPPDQWGTVNEVCDRDNQSPIDITGATYEDLPPLGFGASTENNVAFKNNGHTVAASVSDPMNHPLTGGPLSETYYLAQVHFHWGIDAEEGSEHTIDGKQFPLEAHFVHYKGSLGDIGSAVESDDPDALAVVGIMFDVTYANPVLSHLQHDDHWPKFDGLQTTIGVFDFGGLLSQVDASNFYTYSGSLTTPGCNEIVRWLVMKDSVPCSTAQLTSFRTIHHQSQNGRRDELFRNFRPVQPLNGRSISRSWMEDEDMPHPAVPVPNVPPPPPSKI